MTLAELIEKVNNEKPNSFTNVYLLKIVNEVEARVYDFLETPAAERILHVESELAEDEASGESGESGESGDSGEEQGLGGILLIPEPYSTAYESYLRARLDYANEEFELYANDSAQFNEDFDGYKAYAMRSGLVNTEAIPKQIKNWW